VVLKGRHILLGIGGGIACYRSAELVRLLRAQGAVVRCVMTSSAQKFITPLTLESLSGEPVYHQLFALTDHHHMGHIALARWADVLLIAPATANLIARLAHGMADDLLTTLVLVCEVPIMVAPAMNSSMWQAEATCRNVLQLQQRGVNVVGPEAGELACGEDGLGRMRTPTQLVNDLCCQCMSPVLCGKRWVITTGPTWEAWDSVRMLTNRASGRVGTHIAQLAAWHGAEVTLIAGPGCHSVDGIMMVQVESAQQMLEAALHYACGADMFVSAAAVSDYRIADPVAHKIKRKGAVTAVLALEENEDIVASVASMPSRPTRVVAFAAEELALDVEAAIAEGWRKLESKGVDGVVLNDVSNMGGEQSCGGYWLLPNQSPLVLQGDNKVELAQSIMHSLVALDP